MSRTTCLVLVGLVLPGCSGSQGQGKAPAAGPPAATAQPTSSEATLAWTGADREQAARAVAASLVGKAWLAQFTRDRGRKPVIRFYPIRQRCEARPEIDLRQLAKQIELALVESGKVRLVASPAEADKLRWQRQQEALHGSDETVKGQGREVGADLVLSGTFGCTLARGAATYKLTMELHNVTSMARVWNKDHTVEKRSR
jgi:hypothetical protein